MAALMITTLFLDIGGVLLSDGWNHATREKAAKHFGLDFTETEARHQELFDSFEIDALTLDDYLRKVIFYQNRSFGPETFRSYMFAQSVAYPKMIELMRNLKAKYQLKIGVISNESRELNDYRIETFKLDEFVDYFISSCYVKMRKPTVAMYQLAMDVGHVKPEAAIYIDNLAPFTVLAESLGIASICHTDYESTRKQLAARGFV